VSVTHRFTSALRENRAEKPVVFNRQQRRGVRPLFEDLPAWVLQSIEVCRVIKANTAEHYDVMASGNNVYCVKLNKTDLPERAEKRVLGYHSWTAQ